MAKMKMIARIPNPMKTHKENSRKTHKENSRNFKRLVFLLGVFSVHLVACSETRELIYSVRQATLAPDEAAPGPSSVAGDTVLTVSRENAEGDAITIAQFDMLSIEKLALYGMDTIEPWDDNASVEFSRSIAGRPYRLGFQQGRRRNPGNPCNRRLHVYYSDVCR